MVLLMVLLMVLKIKPLFPAVTSYAVNIAIYGQLANTRTFRPRKMDFDTWTCWQGGPGGHAPPPPSEDFLGGAKIQKGRQNCSKALVKTFVTILEPMKEK